jgi:DNA-binding Lrp family transcriptional regulator
MTLASLDTIDRLLLTHLAANARTPTADLARRVGLSRSATQERLARLERTGVIAGYSVRLGAPAPADRFAAHVFISLDARHGSQLQQALRVRPEVRRCHTVSGEFDVALLVETDGPKALDHLLDDIGRLPGVRRTQSAVVLDVKFERD